MNLEETQKEIKALAGRDVEIVETTYKGQKGFIPEFINFNLHSNISNIFSDTQEGCATKFLEYLRSLQLGGNNGTDTGSEPKDD